MKNWFWVCYVFLLLACGEKNPELAHVGETSASQISDQGKLEIPFLVNFPLNGSIQSLQQIPKDFWTPKGIPLGGARLIGGNLVWVQRVTSSQSELRVFDGKEERVLLNDAEWEYPMLRLGFGFSPTQNWNLYTCVAFGAGCALGPIYELNFEKNRAILKQEPLPLEILNRDFPFGHTHTFHDEKWFAFWQGEFWARVPRKNKSPLIITFDGSKINERFEALFAGDPEQFPINDQIILIESSQTILYVNSFLIFDPVDNQYHESIWNLVEQDVVRGTQTRRMLGSWVEAKNRFEELQINQETYNKFRKTNYSTEWVTALAIWNQQIVEVLNRNLTNSKIKTSSGELIELPNSEVEILIQSRSNLN